MLIPAGHAQRTVPAGQSDRRSIGPAFASSQPATKPNKTRQSDPLGSLVYHHFLASFQCSFCLDSVLVIGVGCAWAFGER